MRWLSAFVQQLHGTVNVSHPDGESFGHAGAGVNREKERAGDRTRPLLADDLHFAQSQKKRLY